MAPEEVGRRDVSGHAVLTAELVDLQTVDLNVGNQRLSKDGILHQAGVDPPDAVRVGRVARERPCNRLACRGWLCPPSTWWPSGWLLLPLLTTWDGVRSWTRVRCCPRWSWLLDQGLFHKPGLLGSLRLLKQGLPAIVLEDVVATTPLLRSEWYWFSPISDSGRSAKKSDFDHRKNTMVSDRITITAGQYEKTENLGVLGSVGVVATEIEWYAQRGWAPWGTC